ncbi:MAG TPA: bifunctional riboflavin kinase/FAD synthetase [Candidatus Avacidaminococcus intestinavium]|uniref:Riboflavin biosynthesis protein n=1 Tax=Candidatus Avacidaminococcus intestinavium TaxID=2840684 RepID=A0A9D1MQJ4_9FIRM|nr:bifunctional riboflavin kinase/FAD synthetase [Candidatus Avacidaminococcus intestinavium]
MQIIDNFFEQNTFAEGSVIALGTFDGLHLGHLDVIKAAHRYAVNKSLKLLVFTFSNHPLAEIKPDAIPEKLISEEDKIKLFEELGVDVLVNVPFTADFSHLTPEDFLDKLGAFNFKCLVVGENYTYGYRGQGNVTLLRNSAKKKGFEVIIRKLIAVDQQVISSSSIRSLIKNGQLKLANRLLGREFTITGIVVKGAGRGNGLGFPTANIEFVNQELLVPASGVYAVTVQGSDFELHGMANIGYSPTFGDVYKKRLEVNIFDFKADLYGKSLKIILNAYIRSESKFNSINELLVQMHKDEKQIRDYFALLNK